MSSSILTVGGFDPEGPFGGLYVPCRLRERQKQTRFKQEWKLTLAQYMAMMLEFKGPKRQRGIICATAAFGDGGGAAGEVLLTTHTFTATRFSPGTVVATVSFETDGQLWGNRSTQSNIQYTGEWWTAEPETSIGDDYEVRALSAGKSGTWSTSAAADNAWITMTANRNWTVSKTGTGIKTTAATFEVGPDGVESADDSATIQASAWVDDA